MPSLSKITRPRRKYHSKSSFTRHRGAHHAYELVVLGGDTRVSTEGVAVDGGFPCIGVVELGDREVGWCEVRSRDRGRQRLARGLFEWNRPDVSAGVSRTVVGSAEAKPNIPTASVFSKSSLFSTSYFFLSPTPRDPPLPPLQLPTPPPPQPLQLLLLLSPRFPFPILTLCFPCQPLCISLHLPTLRDCGCCVDGCRAG